MGKYNTFTQKELPKKNQTHEIWKNLGCLMMVLIPIISIAAGYETVNWMVENHIKGIPVQWLGIPRLPAFIYRSSGLKTLFLWMTDIPNLYAYAAASILYMVIISSVVSVAYTTVYSMIGPSRYGPLDAPPQDVKVTKKSR
jgi:hypothetical protein